MLSSKFTEKSESYKLLQNITYLVLCFLIWLSQRKTKFIPEVFASISPWSSESAIIKLKLAKYLNKNKICMYKLINVTPQAKKLQIYTKSNLIKLWIIFLMIHTFRVSSYNRYITRWKLTKVTKSFWSSNRKSANLFTN